MGDRIIILILIQKIRKILNKVNDDGVSLIVQTVAMTILKIILGNL